MTIGELEQASGISRSTIYFYVRQGLLPVAQKTATSRAVYSEDHLALLREIGRLKADGVSLETIRAEVAARVRSVAETSADATSSHGEQLRRSILIAAARLFARRGYKGTRITDIIDEVGVTPPVFYNHFASKQDLFVEAFGLYVDWTRRSLESGMPSEADPVARELSRAQAYYFGIGAESEDLMSLVRSEAVREEGDLQQVARDTFKHITRATRDDLEGMRRGSGAPLPMADELVAFGLFGAVEGIVMRAGWDSEYSARDVLWAVYAIARGVEAVYSGGAGAGGGEAEYSELIDGLAKGRSSPPMDELV